MKAIDELMIGAGNRSEDARREGREGAASLQGREKTRCIGEEVRRPAGKKAIASSALLDKDIIGVLDVHDDWFCSWFGCHFENP